MAFGAYDAVPFATIDAADTVGGSVPRRAGRGRVGLGRSNRLTARRRRAGLAVGTAFLLTALVALPAAVGRGLGSATPTAGPSAGAPDGYQPPPITHVWHIILENKSYEAAFTGLNQNSYLWSTLPGYGALLRQYYGTGHNSENNYLTLLSGQSPAPSVQDDCPQYVDVTPGTPAPDGQTYVNGGCVYPAAVDTLAGQLDRAGVSWKAYMQDMGNIAGREQPTCGAPLKNGNASPTAPGVPAPTGGSTDSAGTTDYYVPKHNPFVWFHSVVDNPSCATKVVPLDTVPAGTTGRPATSGLLDDLTSAATTPAFSWITPNLCFDAHDSSCPASIAPDGGLAAADLFLEKYVPAIMASPAYQDGGLIIIDFDEGYPPYTAYGNSIADLTSFAGEAGQSPPGNTAQSVVACCNELPGPNTYEPGHQAFGQDTTPGGGVTGAVVLSRYVTPGTISDQPYNHYSWLRSMENLLGVTTGGTDGQGHLGYAGAAGLRPFGPDVYNNPTGVQDAVQKAVPVTSGKNGTYAGRSGPIATDSAPVDPTTGRPVPESATRPFPLPVPANVLPVTTAPTPTTTTTTTTSSPTTTSTTSTPTTTASTTTTATTMAAPSTTTTTTPATSAPTTPPTSAPTSATSSGTASAVVPQGGGPGGGTRPGDAPAVSSGAHGGEPALAGTGAAVGVWLVVALGLVVLGGGAYLLSRRR